MTTATTSDTCRAPRCSAGIHGRGLCRRHYDEWRYSETMAQRVGRDQDAKRLEDETFALVLGHADSVFDSEEECRAAWLEHREELMAREWPCGSRPWAWWAFEAERPQHLADHPDYPNCTSEELDEYYIEPIRYLAANGHLRDDEIEEIKRRADEARPRIGTHAEHYSCLVDRTDRRRVKLYEAVAAALAG